MACQRGGAVTWRQSSKRGVGVGGLGGKGVPGANADAAARDGRKSAARELGGGAFLAGETKARAEACHAGGQRRRHGGKSAWAGALGYLRHNLGVREALDLRTCVRG
jgi:hypothetical protein